MNLMKTIGCIAAFVCSIAILHEQAVVKNKIVDKRHIAAYFITVRKGFPATSYIDLIDYKKQSLQQY